MSDLTIFREDTRQWLEENCPASMRTYMPESEKCWGGRDYSFFSDDQKLWLLRMADRGWTAPTFPKEYGGGGLSKDEAKVLKEELAAITARAPLASMGTEMIGPALLEFGTEALKKSTYPLLFVGKFAGAKVTVNPMLGLI